MFREIKKTCYHVIYLISVNKLKKNETPIQLVSISHDLNCMLFI